jgi:hypothetical protein
MHPSPVLIRVDELHAAYPIFRRQNFDTKKGRLGKDLFVGFRAGHYTNIGHAISRRRNLNALLLYRKNTPLPPALVEIDQDLLLRLAMVFSPAFLSRMAPST